MEEGRPPFPVYEISGQESDDPREREEWFLRLPEHAKREMRERWSAQAGRSVAQKARRRSTTRRYLVEGVALFVLPLLSFYPFTAQTFFLAVAVGLGVGFVAARIRAGAYRYSGVAVAGFAAFTLAIGWVNIFAAFWYVGIGCLLGIGHTLQMFDGSEA
ncbi:MAG: hypothetical protein ACYTGV_10725 [Planctomycetota bacterium]|jgi:hypothetical protein